MENGDSLYARIAELEKENEKFKKEKSVLISVLTAYKRSYKKEKSVLTAVANFEEDKDCDKKMTSSTKKWHEQCIKCKNTKHNGDWVYCVMNVAFCESCSPSCSCDYTYCPACYCQACATDEDTDSATDEDTDNEDE